MKAVLKLAYLALTVASTTHAQDLRGAGGTDVTSKGVLTSETLSSSGFILDEMDDEDREYLLEFQEIMEMDGEEEGKPKKCRGKKPNGSAGAKNGCHKKIKRVCGCNGKTYRNACTANRHRTRVRRLGRCKKEDEIIDAEANTYKVVAKGFLPEDIVQESSASSFSDESEDYYSDFSDGKDEDEEEMDEVDEGLEWKRKCTRNTKPWRCKRIKKKARKCAERCSGRVTCKCRCGMKSFCDLPEGIASLVEEMYEEEFGYDDEEESDSADDFDEE